MGIFLKFYLFFDHQGILHSAPSIRMVVSFFKNKIEGFKQLLKHHIGQMMAGKMTGISTDACLEGWDVNSGKTHGLPASEKDT